MRKKSLSLILAFIVSALFLLMTIASTSAFNFVPYLIHQYISPGGTGESAFITWFDMIFSVLLFCIIYKVVYSLLKGNKQ